MVCGPRILRCCAGEEGSRGECKGEVACWRSRGDILVVGEDGIRGEIGSLLDTAVETLPMLAREPRLEDVVLGCLESEGGSGGASSGGGVGLGELLLDIALSSM